MPDGKKKKLLVPKLRFPEFRDAGEWEVKPLREVLKYERPDKYSVSSEDYQSEGTPVLTANKGFILGYTNEIDGIYENVPVVIFDDFTTDKKYVDFPFKVKSSAIKILSARDQNNIYFLFILMCLIRFDPQQHKRYYISEYQNISVPLPELSEQQKIADCLSSLDKLIELEVQKLDALKQHKKGLMQQLFPEDGETIPRLRFPEFKGTGEWEVKNLGSICKFVRGPFGGALKKNIFVKKGYAVYEQYHAIYGNFDSFRYFITEDKYKELRRFAVLPNDLIMSCSGTMGKFAVIPERYREGVINQALLKLTIKRGNNLKFIKSALELPANKEKILSQSAGGAIKNVVGVGQLKEIRLHIPPSSEQQKIADCLSSLDKLIELEVQKLDTLKQHKKGLMQQLFPQEVT